MGKTISDYSALGNIYVKVYASEFNINRLKENIDKRINMIYEQDTGCGCLE